MYVKYGTEIAKCKLYKPVCGTRNAVFKSTITILATVRKVQVISDKFNMHRVYNPQLFLHQIEVK
jgi:hypothetical protein